MRKNLEFKSFYKLLLILVILLFTFHFSFVPVSSHRFHTSLTLIDFNEKDKSAEISIQMVSHDFNKLFEKRHQKKFNLDKLEESSSMILEYLNENFILKSKSGEICSLKWVGFEKDVDSVWIYVETKIPEGLENATLQNSLFFESHPEQSNLVICKFSGIKADLAFRVGDKSKEIKAKTTE
jgi:hypothetical protein